MTEMKARVGGAMPAAQNETANPGADVKSAMTGLRMLSKAPGRCETITSATGRKIDHA